MSNALVKEAIPLEWPLLCKKVVKTPFVVAITPLLNYGGILPLSCKTKTRSK